MGGIFPYLYMDIRNIHLMQRIVLWLLLGWVLGISARAQEANTLWLSLDMEAGVALGDTAHPQLERIYRDTDLGIFYRQHDFNQSLSPSVGYHFNSTWSIGLGAAIYYVSYRFIAPYVVAKARPFSSLKGLTLDFRLGLPSMLSSHSLDYHASIYSSLGIGWAFHHIWKKLGFYPSVGLNWLSYTYAPPALAGHLGGRERGNSLSAFLRLTLLLD